MLNEQKENRVKLYGVILGIVMLAAQHGIYLLCNEIAKACGFVPFLPKVPAIDDLIPVIPIFIIPYIWAYAFWAMAPMAVSKCDRHYFFDFIAAYLGACLLGGVVLVFFPTYMDRIAEGIWNYPGKGFFCDLMHLWYSMDGSEMAYNLLPSFHCINSTIALLGVWGRKEIPKWFQVYSLVTAILLYASTLFVKQHYFLDVFSGIAVALIAYYLCTHFRVGRVFEKLFDYMQRTFRAEKK